MTDEIDMYDSWTSDKMANPDERLDHHSPEYDPERYRDSVEYLQPDYPESEE